MDAEPIGKRFLNSSSPGVVLVFSVASNTSGAIIRTGYINPVTGTVNLVAGTVAPTGIGDVSQPIIFSGNGNSAAGSNSEVVMPYPLYIPAGMGLWVANSGPGAIALTWDLLS